MKQIKVRSLFAILILLACSLNLNAVGIAPLNPMQITSVQQKNLMALSKLYGYARYFYPNPNLKEFDWLRFLMYAVPQTLRANNNTELKRTLHQLFVPLVPELTFSRTPKENDKAKSSSDEKKEMYVREIQAQAGDCSDLTFGEIKHIPYSEGLPYPDKIYSFQLAKRLYANYSISITKLPQEKNENLTKLINNANKEAWLNMTYFCNPVYRLANAIIEITFPLHFYPYFQEDSLASHWDPACAEHLEKVAACTRYPEYLYCTYELMSQLHDCHLLPMNGIAYTKSLGRCQHCYMPWNFTTAPIENRMIVTWSGIDSLKRGDEIVAVNGIPMSQFFAEKLKYIPASTHAAAFLRFNNEEAFKTFSKDSVITLSAKSLDGKIKKAKITPDSEYGAAEDQNAKFITNLGDSIYKINACVNASSYKQFLAQFAEFKKAKGLIIDMRGYPRECIYYILSNLIDTTLHVGKIETPIYYFPHQRNRKLVINHGESDWAIYPAIQEHRDPQTSIFNDEEAKQLVKERLNVPIIFLTDARCMSQGETLMEMIKRQKVGKIVGEPTCGTNGDAITLFLKTVGYSMTSLRFTNGDGTQHHGIGVLPDVPCSQTLADFKDHKDTIVEKAKSLLKQGL